MPTRATDRRCISSSESSSERGGTPGGLNTARFRRVMDGLRVCRVGNSDWSTEVPLVVLLSVSSRMLADGAHLLSLVGPRAYWLKLTQFSLPPARRRCDAVVKAALLQGEGCMDLWEGGLLLLNREDSVSGLLRTIRVLHHRSFPSADSDLPSQPSCSPAHPRLFGCRWQWRAKSGVQEGSCLRRRTCGGTDRRR